MKRREVSDKLKTAMVATAGRLLRTGKSPEELFGELFEQVQLSQVYEDGKTFVDLLPRKRATEILKEYELSSKDPNFDLREFTARHFYEFAPHKDNEEFNTSPADNPVEHINNLWRQLERRNRVARGSLVALPYPYIVPGGRFSEQFYWDTYFIMLGLAADDNWSPIEKMMKNYAHMIQRFGFIPTANRTYFLSRSQPPFFALMVQLLASKKNRSLTYLEYLPHLLAEYRFWIKGQSKLKNSEISKAYLRNVRMPNQTILGRYYDNKKTPRPESQREDVETAEISLNQDKEKVFLDLRAGAESGWDFSSRWFRNPSDIASIRTTDIVPVDLNSLLYMLEETIAEAYRMIRQPLLERKFRKLAEKRAEAIRKYFWNEQTDFFHDYDYIAGHTTESLTLAGVFPLYAGVATHAQADAVAKVIKEKFLLKGGVVTTLEETGQQWDYPNGWAPLQWVTIQGLKRYGHDELADEVKRRWMDSVEIVFSTKHKMIEKYDVAGDSRIGGGGEYPLQDGFGWTNGVYRALHSNFEVPYSPTERQIRKNQG